MQPLSTYCKARFFIFENCVSKNFDAFSCLKFDVGPKKFLHFNSNWLSQSWTFYVKNDKTTLKQEFSTGSYFLKPTWNSWFFCLDLFILTQFTVHFFSSCTNHINTSHFYAFDRGYSEILPFKSVKVWSVNVVCAAWKKSVQ